MARTLAGTPRLARLEVLRLGALGFGEGEYHDLIASPHLPAALRLVTDPGEVPAGSALASRLTARFPGPVTN